MKKIIKSMFTANVASVPAYVDALAFYDEESNKIIVISANDYKNCNFSNYNVINKTSELTDFDYIKLVNLSTFIRKNPTSGIEKYIDSKHSRKVYEKSDLYLAAYITLYKYYKSFETLVDNNYINFIDTFIDSCIRNKSDHPNTICYFNYDIHKIFKLRKTVFTMFKDYLNSYNNYLYIYTNQNDFKYTDQQFRVFLKTLKVFNKTKTVEKKQLIETLANFSDNEIA